jgi:hypothetical protein
MVKFGIVLDLVGMKVLDFEPVESQNPMVEIGFFAA